MKREIGIHISIWTSEWTEPFLDYINLAGEIGFDVVEIPLINPEKLDLAGIRRRLKQTGMKVLCGTGLGSDTDISSFDSGIRRKGEKYLLTCIEAAAEVGSSSLGGVIHSAWGRTGVVSFEERKRAADILGKVADRAAEDSMYLALECINRYENSLLNTAEQGLNMLDMIEHDNVGIHLDTYHMNIEELSLIESIRKTGEKLFHFHASGNNRGFPRRDGVFNWPEIINVLDAIGYKRPIVIESYVVPGCGAGDDVSVWRNIEPDTKESLKKSLEYLRSL